jgi:hypothetical protein
VKRFLSSERLRLLENFGRFNYALYKEKEMADFRRFMIVLAAVALLLGTVSTVSAQVAPPLSCSASAVPTQSRQQGETELMGDVVLQCQGGTPTGLGLPDPLVNVQVFLNATNITSRILSTSGATNGATEALLIVDDGSVPPTAGQFCPVSPCDNIGQGSIPTSPYAVAGNKSVFYGTWNAAQPNSITFAGIPIDAPGTAGGVRTLRITNIRGNTSPFLSGAQITEFVSVSGSNPSVPINTPTQVVSLVQNGINVTSTSLINFSQCTSVAAPGGKISIADTDVGNGGILTVSKGFFNAFKVRNSSVTTVIDAEGSGNITATPIDQNTPGSFNVNTETGFYSSTFPAPFGGTSVAAGLADTGTRIAVLFQNVPTGAHVYVPLLLTALSPVIPGTSPALNYATGSLAGVLVSGETGTTVITAASSADNTGNGVFGLAEVTLTSNAGEVVYEVSNANPGQPEQFQIPITVAYIANPGAGTPAFGVATVGASFAPRIADILAETSSVAIPRFIDSSVQKKIFGIVACSTTLLFPFVTNQAGYDTGLAISNTSMDPFGTSTQTGACTLTMFGATPTGTPTSVPFDTTSDTRLTNGLVVPGTTWAYLSSIMFPTYQGYVIAVCNFQYAHGFAFVLDPTLHVAQGYLALIIPGVNRAKAANPFTCTGGECDGSG